LSIPYDLGGEKPFFPDLVIVRKKDGDGYEVDIIEPHDDSRTDTWAKVKGLAKFADEHHLEFGRLMVGRKKDGKPQIIDVSDAKVRENARKLAGPADLNALFELGTLV
jgi:type III restriction enzyme